MRSEPAPSLYPLWGNVSSSAALRGHARRVHCLGITMRRDSDYAMSRPVPLVALALLCGFCLLRSAAAAEAASIHTIFSTECNRYFDWCVPQLHLARAHAPSAVAGLVVATQHNTDSDCPVPPLTALFVALLCRRQSLGLIHSAKHVGQEGPITRLMACNECVCTPAPLCVSH